MPVNTGSTTTNEADTNCWACTAAGCCNLLAPGSKKTSGMVATDLGMNGQSAEHFGKKFVKGWGVPDDDFLAKLSGKSPGGSAGAEAKKKGPSPESEGVPKQIEQLKAYVQKNTGKNGTAKEGGYKVVLEWMKQQAEGTVFAFYFTSLGYTPGHWICARKAGGQIRFLDYQQDTPGSPRPEPAEDAPQVNGKAIPADSLDAVDAKAIAFL